MVWRTPALVNGLYRLVTLQWPWQWALHSHFPTHPHLMRCEDALQLRCRPHPQQRPLWHARHLGSQWEQHPPMPAALLLLLLQCPQSQPCNNIHHTA